MDFYKNKNVLVTGGTGLIGRPLIKKLKKLGANLTVVSLDNPSPQPLKYQNIFLLSRLSSLFQSRESP